MRDFHKKKVLITGGAAGIGRALALRFAGEGAQVHLVDIKETALQQTVEEIRDTGAVCDGTVCDLSDGTELNSMVDQVLDRHQHIDVLVNNAGIAYYGRSVSMTRPQCDEVLAVNFLAPVRLTHRLLPTLLSRPTSHVLNVASMYGLFVTRRCSAYHATKYGLVGYSAALRAEFGRYGLGVTALCPGYVQTGLFDAMLRHPNQKQPAPPRWLTTTADKVAARAIRGVRRNRRLVLATPWAHVATYFNQLFPGLFDSIYQIGSRRSYPLPDRSSEAKPQLL